MAFETKRGEDRLEINTIWVDEVCEMPLAAVPLEFNDDSKPGWPLARGKAINADQVARSMAGGLPDRVVCVWILAVQERVEVESHDFALGL